MTTSTPDDGTDDPTATRLRLVSPTDGARSTDDARSTGDADDTATVDVDPAELPVGQVTDDDLTPYRELSQEDRAGEELVVADPLADDVDLLVAADSLEEVDDPDFLTTDELAPARDDEDGWEPPQQEVVLEQGQTLDERLAAEVPEPDPRAAGDGDAVHDLLET